MDSAPTEHAHAVGRHAIAAGLVSQAAVAELFPVYQDYLRKGANGTFTQLLLSRGLITEEGYQALESHLPAYGTRASGRFSLPAEDLGSTLQFEDVLEEPVAAPIVVPPGLPGESAARLPAAPPAPPVAPGGSAARLPAAPAWGSGARLPASPPPAAPPAPAQPANGLTPSLGSGAYRVAISQPAPARPASGLAASLDSSHLESRSTGPDSTADGSRRDDSGLALMPSDDENAGEKEFFDAPDDESGETAGAPSEPQIGDTLGEYELLEVIGRGGMGVIYKARKEGSSEPYALKTLLTRGSSKSKNKARERFRREVEALRRLSHPGIVKVHTCGRKAPWDWYVMDFIEGRELKQLMATDWAKPLWEKLEIFEEICKAVQHAHERFVIHRDLKPANILVDNGGQVIVLDFGLAKLFDEEMSLTKTGATLGTPYYMAPEQLLNPKAVDSRADVYALGALLYEMMVGRPPFLGETFGVISNKIMNEDPPPPSTIREGLHPSLDALCLKALEKDPDRRHRDADAFRLAVATYRRGSRNVSLVDRVKDGSRRFLDKNAYGFMVGVVVSSLVYWPLLFFVYFFM